MSTYSLWFMSSGASEVKLRELIADLAAEFSLDSFPPHVTLMGGVRANEQEAIDNTRALSGEIRPARLRLGKIDFTANPHMALFSDIDKTDDLVVAYDKAARYFSVKHKSAYRPHLSLLYGDMEVSTKLQLAQRLANRLGGFFEADRLALYRTEGPVTEWREVRGFALS